MVGIMSPFDGACLREYINAQQLPQFALLRQSIIKKLSQAIPSNHLEDLSHQANVNIAFTIAESRYINNVITYLVNDMHDRKLNQDETLILNAFKRVRNVVI